MELSGTPQPTQTVLRANAGSAATKNDAANKLGAVGEAQVFELTDGCLAGDA